LAGEPYRSDEQRRQRHQRTARHQVDEDLHTGVNYTWIDQENTWIGHYRAKKTARDGELSG